MSRIVFIGAGSFGFTRTLVRDILTFPALRDAELVLMDIDERRLAYITKAIRMIVARGKYPAKVVATKSRTEALKGADFVICTVLAGGVQVWRHDIEIPKKYGVDFNVGDTRGAAGVFRALRTIPLMLSICRDMERLCPDAILLNYTNPMAMLCNAMQTVSKIRVTGLCHSVQGTAEMIARWIGAKMEDVTYLCAGINHQAWYLEYKVKGKDAYPALRKAVTKPSIYGEEIVRNELFKHLGLYVTESSGHASEYVWWFRKRQDLIEKYCHPSKGWNPGRHAFILNEYLKAEQGWEEWIKAWLKEGKVDLKRGHEYAAWIINAVVTGEIFVFNGNVMNNGAIDNLPDDACVEIPVVTDKSGFRPIRVGSLPTQCAALNHVNVSVERLAVQASLEGDPMKVFHALCFDPASSSVLSLEETRKMTREMLERNKSWLPQFRNVRI